MGILRTQQGLIVLIFSPGAMRYGKKIRSNYSCYYSLFNRRQQNVLPNVTYSPSHRQGGTPMIKIQSTLRILNICVKNVSHAKLFARKCISSTVCTHSDMCVCVFMQYSSQYRQAARAKEIKYGITVTAACKENFRGAILCTHAIGSSALH